MITILEAYGDYVLSVVTGKVENLVTGSPDSRHYDSAAYFCLHHKNSIPYTTDLHGIAGVEWSYRIAPAFWEWSSENYRVGNMIFTQPTVLGRLAFRKLAKEEITLFGKRIYARIPRRVVILIFED